MDCLAESNDTFEGDAPADLIARGNADLLRWIIFEVRSGVSS
jgi:hypothetical protein